MGKNEFKKGQVYKYYPHINDTDKNQTIHLAFILVKVHLVGGHEIVVESLKLNNIFTIDTRWARLIRKRKLEV